MKWDYVYLFIIGLLFVIDSEVNSHLSIYNLRHLQKYNVEHSFILEEDPNFYFKRGRFRFKKPRSRNRAELWEIVCTKRRRIDNMLTKVFGKEKYNDMKVKSDSELIKKYGRGIKSDIEIMNIFLENYDRKFEKNKIKKF